ncbi:hypothetical protein ABZ671_31105 [Micromonospora sp. NPDC006766]|uniref:hypothetical protein n=1 Tax=Micromonospora sp. NPDC006766 TaxID=3154778 RepID=UPI00340E867B
MACCLRRTGHYGGISLDQWEQIKGVAGVEVPLSGMKPEYFVYTDGTRIPQPTSAQECPADGGGGPLEVQADGSRRQVCLEAIGSFDPALRRTHDSRVEAYQILPDRRLRAASVFTQGRPLSAVPVTDRLEIDLSSQIPLLMAAVDPAAEARLFGLDRATTVGRYLTADDTLHGDGQGNPSIPVIAVADLRLDERVDVAASRLSTAHAEQVVWDNPEEMWRHLHTVDGARLRTTTYELADLYRERLDSAMSDGSPLANFSHVVQIEPPAYRQQPEGAVRVQMSTDRKGGDGNRSAEDLWHVSWLLGDGDARPWRQVTVYEAVGLGLLGSLVGAAVGVPCRGIRAARRPVG